MPSAYLLVSHGSRDPRPEIAMQQLAKLVDDKLSRDKEKNLVGIACLEASPQPLHLQIEQFAFGAVAAGCRRLQIMPVFLLPGVHVSQDIPKEVALAVAALGNKITIHLQPYLGSHPKLASLLSKQIAVKNQAAWILLAHGSRRPGSQQPVEALAAKLATVIAYWSVSGSLESRVKELVEAGKKEIAIFPYFLFSGGITDAIAQTLEALKLQFPGVSFHLAEPLGASAELAELIWDLINTSTPQT